MGYIEEMHNTDLLYFSANRPAAGDSAAPVFARRRELGAQRWCPSACLSVSARTARSVPYWCRLGAADGAGKVPSESEMENQQNVPDWEIKIKM
jgi:hypothetical protein